MIDGAIRLVNGAAVAWAEVAWAVAWQAPVVVGAFALAVGLLRRAGPSVRCWAWHLAALKLLIMPFWVASLAIPGLIAAPEPPTRAAPGGGRGLAGPTRDLALRPPAPSPPAVGSRVDDSRRREPITWQAGLFLAWSGLVLLRVVGLGRQRRRLVRLLAGSVPAADPALLALVDHLAERVGLAKSPAVRLIAGGTSPFVANLGRPVLVLPGGLLRDLAPAALEAVLLHELAHLRRRDLLWGWVPTVARLVYAGHPAATYVADRARLERELACDATAMILADQGPASYAATLVEVVTRSASPARMAATTVQP